MNIQNRRTIPYLLVAILVTAAILRFNHINQPFTDALSWRQSSIATIAENFYHNNWNIFYPEVSWTGSGPGYQEREFPTISYITALLYVLFGQQDWVGRSVAVLFGLWGIFALYQLVRRVWDEERALVSAAVMAVLPGSVFIERSFLPDPVMVSLVVTGFWMWVAYLQTQRLRYLLMAIAVGTLGFATKIPTLIVVVPIVYTTLVILPHQRLLPKQKRIAAKRPTKMITSKPRQQVQPLSVLGAMCILALFTIVPAIAYYFWARYLALSHPPYGFVDAASWVWDQGLPQWWSQGYFLPSLSQTFYSWMWTPPAIALVSFGLLFNPAREEDSQNSELKKQLSYAVGKAPWLFHWWLLAGVVYYLIAAKELISHPWTFHIINPVAAALAGHGIVVIASFVNRVVGSPAALGAIAVFLFIVGGVGQNSLKPIYKPYAQESYKLGLALRQISQPEDLVVTMANTCGDPVAIYYSQRHGWVFPPAQPEQPWNQLPEDDDEAIRMFEELRTQGAGWLGIVDERKNDFWKDHPKLVEHIKRTSEFKSKNSEKVIYRILTLQEVANLPNPNT